MNAIAPGLALTTLYMHTTGTGINEPSPLRSSHALEHPTPDNLKMRLFPSQPSRRELVPVPRRILLDQLRRPRQISRDHPRQARVPPRPSLLLRHTLHAHESARVRHRLDIRMRDVDELLERQLSIRPHSHDCALTVSPLPGPALTMRSRGPELTLLPVWSQ